MVSQFLNSTKAKRVESDTGAIRKKRTISRFGKNPAIKPFCNVMRFDYNRPTSLRTSAVKSRHTAHMSVIGFDPLCGMEVSTTVPALNSIAVLKKLESKSSSTKIGIKNINGFIGFRTFYSRMFPNLHQQRLSTLLSKTWMKYDNKDFWARYAALYCAEARSEGFADWLLARTHPPALPQKEEFFALLQACISPSKSRTVPLNDELQHTIGIMDEASDDHFFMPSEQDLMYMSMIISGENFADAVLESVPIFEGSSDQIFGCSDASLQFRHGHHGLANSYDSEISLPSYPVYGTTH
ncbi:uncharacterized protein V2V93DRAFT_134952 [Kockiozyma suomiensis]|uniref:uncharacterized protein n=1 Tax=Kockiozyma suomiensis TaxID=1337062 RepID=UPI003343E575